MKFFLLSLLSFLILNISGCSSYKAMKHFNQEDLYTKAVQNTKKTDLLVNDEINFILNVTYLNAISESFDTKTQNFITGLYIINEDDKKEFKNNYLFTMNNKRALKIEKLSKNHPMYNSIPLKNRWATYYIVEFEKDNKINKLNLSLTYKNKEKTSLNFLTN